MKKLACFILGTCLMLQAVPLQHSSNTALAAALETEDLTGIPFYSLEHARELLNEDEFARLNPPEREGQDLSQVEYARFIHKRTRDLLPKHWRPQARRIARALIDAGNRHQMDPLLLMAVIRQESRFNPRAIGSHGEIGLMQIKPSTARWILEKNEQNAPSEERMREMLKDPVTNIRYGSAYLAHLRESFNGKRHLYISAYNMGARNVRSHLKSGNNPRIYSDQVLDRYVELASAASISLHRSLERHVASSSWTLDL